MAFIVSSELHYERILQSLNTPLLAVVIEESELHRISQHCEQMKSGALGKSVFQVKQRGNCRQQMLRRGLG
jgi:hypothetical protein